VVVTSASTRSRPDAVPKGTTFGSEWLITDHRRLIPIRLRRLLLDLLPKSSLDRLKRLALRAAEVEERLARLGGRTAAVWLKRRKRDLEGKDQTVVAVGWDPRLALIDSDLSGLHARDENLRVVCTALANAGIEYFSIRGASDLSAIVGVSAAEKPRAVAALAQLCTALPFYVADASVRVGLKRSRPGRSRRVWRKLRAAKIIRLTLYRTDRSGLVVRGVNYGCDVEFWEQYGDRLIEPRPNLAIADIDIAGAGVMSPSWMFTRLASQHGRKSAPVRTRPNLVVQMPDDIEFPIDVVYAASAALEQTGAESSPSPGLEQEMLRYLLRSLDMHAPWVRYVHVAIEGREPPWLDQEASELRRVQVGDLPGERSFLTGRGQATTELLHRIDDLSECFIYIDHATFFTHDVIPNHFFHGNGILKIPTAKQQLELGPHVLRRDVLEELVANPTSNAGDDSTTSAPHVDDRALTGHRDRAFATARAAPAHELRYATVNLAAPRAHRHLERLVADRGLHVLALEGSGQEQTAKVRSRVKGFLDRSFPLPSRFEHVSR
jgi:hypothetical protein